MAQHPDYPHTISVQDCDSWFKVSVTFNTIEEAQAFHSRIPKSYRMHVNKLYTDERVYHQVSAHITLKPTELTGTANETGKARIIKIKKILQKLAPDFRVRRQLLIPVPGERPGTYRYGGTVEGW